MLGAPLPPGSSFLRWLFLDPAARRRIENWARFAVAAVGALRYEAGRHPEDHLLQRLVVDLRAADPDVARWWQDHHVRDQTSFEKHVAHPRAGRLVFGIEAVVLPHQPDQRLVVYTVEPGSATAAVLPLLAVWAYEGRETSAVHER